MKIAIQQPDFLPWLGFFHKWQISDLLIIYDDAQFIKGGWQNRERIRSGDSEQWLTVPVNTKGRLGQLISEVEISYRNDWIRQHLNAISINYGRSRNYANVFPALQEIYQARFSTLLELNMAFLKRISGFLGISIPVKFASYYHLSSTRTRKLIDMLKEEHATGYITGQGSKDYLEEDLFREEGIAVHYQTAGEVHLAYPEVDPGTLGLSVLHALFCDLKIKNQ